MSGFRIETDQGLSLMRFDLLEENGIAHGLAVKNAGGDIHEEAIYRRLAAEGPLAVTRQRHSTVEVYLDSSWTIFYPQEIEADGLTTDIPGIKLAIHTADCLPVFLAAPWGQAVGLFHCGWRGTAQGFLTQAVKRFAGRFGIGPERLLAVIGPGIEAECYPVGREVAENFSDQVKRTGDDGRWLLNLRAENNHQLLSSGLRPEHIQVIELCTRCRQDLFHSYRREGDGLRGQMVSFIEAGREKRRR